MVEAIIFFVYKIILSYLLPLAGVILLGWIAWKFWVHYIQQDFISGIEFVLLEIVPPRDVLRSPQAMELFITATKEAKRSFGREPSGFGFLWKLPRLTGRCIFIYERRRVSGV